MLVRSIELFLVALGITYFAIGWHVFGNWLLLVPYIFAAVIVAAVSSMDGASLGTHWCILAVRYGASLGTHCGTWLVVTMRVL